MQLKSSLYSCLRIFLSLAILFLNSVFILNSRAEGSAWTILDWNWPSFNVTLPLANSKNNNATAAMPSKYVVSYVNGIYHSEDDWMRVTELLDDVFGQEVKAFYNPSTGRFFADLAGAFYDLISRSNTHSVARALSAHLQKTLKEAGPKGRVLHIAHSGGALVTYLAGKYHLKLSERSRIDVVTFGGAHSITRKLFPGRTVNYYARNDPLVQVDRRAALLMKRTSNQTFEEVIYAKHDTPFVFMQGLTKNALVDHSLEGPTYKEALRMEAEELQNRAMKTIVPINVQSNSTSDVDPIRIIRKKSAELTGLHGFFSGKKNLESLNPTEESWKIPLLSKEALRKMRHDSFIQQESFRIRLSESAANVTHDGLIVNGSIFEIGGFEVNQTDDHMGNSAVVVVDLSKMFRGKFGWLSPLFGASNISNATCEPEMLNDIDEMREQEIINSEKIESLQVQTEEENAHWWERAARKVKTMWNKTGGEHATEAVLRPSSV